MGESLEVFSGCTRDRSGGLYLHCQCPMSVCAETTHFEDEQRQRCVLDADDRALVDKKVAMHPHPLEAKRKAAD